MLEQPTDKTGQDFMRHGISHVLGQVARLLDHASFGIDEEYATDSGILNTPLFFQFRPERKYPMIWAR